MQSKLWRLSSLPRYSLSPKLNVIMDHFTSLIDIIDIMDIIDLILWKVEHIDDEG